MCSCSSSSLTLLPYHYSTTRLLSKRFSSSSSTKTLTLTLALDSPLRYGPSLSKGQNPNPNGGGGGGGGGGDTIDRSSFSRAFDVAALRVPAADCSSLEGRLRGHLLNWPRVRNIARSPGDDFDPGIKNLLLRSENSPDRLDPPSLDGGGQLSPVLYRDKLSKQFNCQGFVKFRNLAKISRPKKKKKRKEGEAKERGDRENCYEFEVIGSGEEEEEEMKGLLGEDFRGGGRWQGPTRLLLLDEKYAKRGAEELPEAIKAVLLGDALQSRPSISELVRCRLTLSYNYWQMNELLEALLPEGMIVPTGFETVGHIAHLNLRDEHLPYKKLIAQVVLDKNKPKIQTVVNKIDAIQNDYRTMQLEVLAGNHSLVTTVIENGIRFQVDLATVYWSSRLATERQRLVCCFSKFDVVCDVFAGVGPLAISAAKKVKYVYANDLNPHAVEYLERNIVLNKLDRKIEVSNMEGRRFIHSIFASQRPFGVTQVVMNLPKDAAEFLDSFRGIFKNRPKDVVCTLPKIHVYGFSKSDNPEFDFQERINMVLDEKVEDMEMHRVRLVAPGKWMLCASFILPKTVAFANHGHKTVRN